LREIRAVARLRHPNIVSAYSAFRCGDDLVFAMEYVAGLNLAQVVKAKGAIAVRQACFCIHQAALGLQYAHEEGVVHRDIKPANLMLSHHKDRPLIKLLDFGLSKAASEQNASEVGIGLALDAHDFGEHLTCTGDMLGTPDFIAPEQIADSQQADIRADIYSLGCTLYYLLTGRAPFPDLSLRDVLKAHRSQHARPLDQLRADVPTDLAAIVARLMAKEPARRFQTPGEVAEALVPFFKKGNVALVGSKPDISRPELPEAKPAAPGAVPMPPRPHTDTASAPAHAAGNALDVAGPGSILEGLINLDDEGPLAHDTMLDRPPAPDAPEPGGRRFRMLRPMIIAGSVLGILLLGVIIYVVTDKGRIKIVVGGPRPIVTVDGETVRIEGFDEPITLRTGEHVLTATWHGAETETRKFIVRRGDNEELRIEYEPRVSDRAPPDRQTSPSSQTASRDTTERPPAATLGKVSAPHVTATKSTTQVSITPLKSMTNSIGTAPDGQPPIPPKGEVSASRQMPKQAPTNTRPANGLLAEFFEGRKFERKLKACVDANVDWLWGGDAPDPEVPKDNFSARWTGWLKAPRPGRYEIIAVADDGVRLWLEGDLLIDEWHGGWPTRYAREVDLTGKPQALRLDYFEINASAVISLRWEQAGRFQERAIPVEALFLDELSAERTAVSLPNESPSGNANGLHVEFFEGIELGRKLKTRVDTQVDWLWGWDAPDPEVPKDRFSARWTGWLKAFRPGRYRIIAVADDGVRLWLDGHLLIDGWRSQLPRRYTAEVELTGKAQPLKLEYFEVGGSATISLRWEQYGGFREQPIPAPAFFRQRDATAAGAATGSRSAPFGRARAATVQAPGQASPRPNY
jgi:hypothetical protein